jgi:hypothetical protein
MTVAASRGDLGVLKLGRQHGCAWDEGTTAAAASYNHIDCLRWLQSQGCPLWKEAIPLSPVFARIACTRVAMMADNFDVRAPVLLYADRYGAPLPFGCSEFVENRKKCCLAFLSCFTRYKKMLAQAEAEGRMAEVLRYSSMGTVNQDLLENILLCSGLWVRR